MKYRIAPIVIVAVSLLGGGACQAAGQCRGSKIFRNCFPTNNTLTATCYSLKVPCSFDESDLGQTAFSVFQYPVEGIDYNVPLVPAY